ncbi:MAG: ROK family protein, partial [Candidatus Omnitrophica bacterium]|nr:ROK family protein [Candidatus Omnitrophota bacterium]
GRGARSLVCLMLGTGVGGGLILDGRLYRGWTMSAGEIGHVPLGWDGPPCPCGGRGCLEQYAGNRAIVALARRKLAGRRSRLRRDRHRLTPPLIDEAAYRGDRVAREVWQEIGRHLGLALTMVANLVNPDRIVIGGGIAKAGPLLFPTIRATVKARAMRGPSSVPIVPAHFGASAGLVGAAALVLAPPPRRML